MITVEVAPYFRLFLFTAMLNTDGSMHNLKRIKFPNLGDKYHNFLWHALPGRWVLKMHFLPFDYIEKQKGLPSIKKIVNNVYTPL
jgi:hypothetical protein